MAYIDEVIRHLPELRRYGYAMTGSREQGDGLVERTLMRLVADPGRPGSDGARVGLFRTFHAVNGFPDPARQPEPPPRIRDRLVLQVTSLPPETRAIFILGYVLRFTTEEVGRILDMDETTATETIRSARLQLMKFACARVLIIEDDYLIAQEIAHMVENVGQQVCGPVATYADAISCAAGEAPTLVLADIQLRNGRIDGLRAGSDVAREHQVPLYVITGYPERIAMDSDVRPARVFTKPFDYAALRGAITNPANALPA